MKLFACVSNLKWDYTKNGAVGHIFLKNPERIIPFDFTNEGEDSVEITNKLWELMDSDE